MIGNGDLEYIEPYIHNVRRTRGGTVREVEGNKRGISGRLFQGPKFGW